MRYNPLRLEKKAEHANQIWFEHKDASEYECFDVKIHSSILKQNDKIVHWSKRNPYDVFETHTPNPENWKDTNCMKCSLLKDRKYCPIHDQNLSKWTGYKGLCGFFVPKEKSDISQTMSDKCLTPK